VTYTFYEFLPVFSPLPCGNQPQNNSLNLIVALTLYLACFKTVSSKKKIYICSWKAFWDRRSCVMVLLTCVSLHQCLVRQCGRFRWENHFLIQSVNLNVFRPIVIRLRKNITSLMPFYKWSITACLPRKVWFVSNFVLATEWWRYVLEILYAFGYEFCMILLHTAKCQRGELVSLRGCVLLLHKTTSLSVSDLTFLM